MDIITEPLWAPDLATIMVSVTMDPVPLEGLAAAVDIRQAMDAWIRISVRRCRAAGHSWEEIGVALRVTRQAAHERFSANL